jgi:hypothetical protein
MQGFQAWIDDNGALRIQPIQAEADGLPKPPLKAIAHHSLSHGAWHSKADSRAGGNSITFRLAGAESCEQRAGEASAPVIDSSKIL